MALGFIMLHALAMQESKVASVCDVRLSLLLLLLLHEEIGVRGLSSSCLNDAGVGRRGRAQRPPHRFALNKPSSYLSPLYCLVIEYKKKLPSFLQTQTLLVRTPTPPPSPYLPWVKCP
jgi:hypothetical protein